MEQYTPGDSQKVTQFMTRRTLATHGSFFRPFLFPGATILDCGCGPGTITRDIAPWIAPSGRLYGVDFNAGQIDLAQQSMRDVPGVEFRVANAYELPFDANSFDAVFSHALFEHLADPDRAARELLRVLKPGGIVGLRSPDWTGRLSWPSSDCANYALSFYSELQAANGGDLTIGRKLASIVRRNGFVAIRSSAAYECYSPVQVIGEYLAAQIERCDHTPSGQWTTRELAEELRLWSRQPDAFFAQAWGEVIAQKAI